MIKFTLQADTLSNMKKEVEQLHNLLNAGASQITAAPSVPEPKIEQSPAVEETSPSIPEAPAAPASEATGGDLDVNGLPWDARIHGSNKTKNVDGSWRNKRGVDKTLLAQVEAELRGQTAQAAPVQQTVPSVPEAPAAPVQEVPQAPVASVVQNVAQVTWPQFIQLYTQKIAAGVTKEQVDAICANHGHVGGIPTLSTNADVMSKVYAELANA